MDEPGGILYGVTVCLANEVGKNGEAGILGSVKQLSTSSPERAEEQGPRSQGTELGL